MLTLYVICLLVGVVFAVLSFVFSGFFESHVNADVDVSGGEIGADAGGDAGVGDVHFPFMSPVVIATFVTFFGAGGLVGLKVFGFMPGLSVLVALAMATGVAFLAGVGMVKLQRSLETNAVTTAQSLIGTQAEVTENIPGNGVGEISFSGKGTRITGPARSEENRDIARHALVTITRVVGGLYYVREHVDEKLRNLEVPTDGSPAANRGGEKK